ncbi:hypothetical protein CO662_05345 [Rhizobium anhuiense]|jgi:hypothetical protein|uniref:Uncharacterized protein n=1 Tax=Rhizobium anhuiense TaxID=1184720 RepID=A0ABX4JCS5_9HYPH|nr:MULTISPECIES: hypothetical protein [Rhizobium]MBB3299962.1 hypothetical protein [Rhizobium sp. BK112]MBB3369419.1 hypothetical protein [Rhizobium sp. BK077]MBB4112615.1 hypothetical protein [Rhizobium sp. BK226]MBB4180036.1 hypothetical protein [Rhizobium sp. BK109]MBB4212965.1 hypothetical protein [Rhizobium sp. BK212]
MPLQTADVIDFQAYRQSRCKDAADASKALAPASFAMQPVLMWVPYWGFIPVMAMGIAGYGV